MSKLSPTLRGECAHSRWTWTQETLRSLGVCHRRTTKSRYFPRYGELFEDDVLDIAIHFGGDYNEERLDIETAKWLVELLLEDDWQNEAFRI